MSKRRYGHERIFMASTLTKEATYAAGVTVNASNYRKYIGFLGAPQHEHIVSNDLEEHTGVEAATAQQIVEYRTKLPLEFPRVYPDALVAFSALALGSLTSSQEGDYTSYKHLVVPCAVGTALSSIAMHHDPGNRQDGYVGVKAGSFEISAEQEGFWRFMAELISSGQMTETSATFQASVSNEVLLEANKTKVYVKTSPTPASDWIASASVSQTTSNIDAAQGLTSIGDTVMNWSFKHNNNPDMQAGMGGSGYLQGIDFQRRGWEFTMTVRYESETWRDRFTAGTAMSIELNCNSGTLVDGSGANKYGAILRLAKCVLKEQPEPQEGPGDAYTLTLNFEVMDDGTNPVFDLHVYNATAAYLQ